jgi:hypothetical protein
LLLKSNCSQDIEASALLGLFLFLKFSGKKGFGNRQYYFNEASLCHSLQQQRIEGARSIEQDWFLCQNDFSK